jgi:hypothetical protein
MMLASDSLFRTAAVTGVDSLYDEDVAGWNGAAVARSSLIIARRPLPRSSGVGATQTELSDFFLCEHLLL